MTSTLEPYTVYTSSNEAWGNTFSGCSVAFGMMEADAWLTVHCQFILYTSPGCWDLRLINGETLDIALISQTGPHYLSSVCLQMIGIFTSFNTEETVRDTIFTESQWSIKSAPFTSHCGWNLNKIMSKKAIQTDRNTSFILSNIQLKIKKVVLTCLYYMNGFWWWGPWNIHSGGLHSMVM